VRKGFVVEASGKRTEKQLGYPYFRRMGWQTKNKAVLIDKRRIIVPLYSDGFSFSLMAISDDCGATWKFSEPLVGPGNIQPSIAVRADGTLATFMRDNGPAPKRLHISTSADKGLTWSGVRDSALVNPGSGADVVTLRNGHWIIALRDKSVATRSHYPSIIEGRDGAVHVVYSYHHNDRKGSAGKTIKYARFNEAWVEQQ